MQLLGVATGVSAGLLIDVENEKLESWAGLVGCEGVSALHDEVSFARLRTEGEAYLQNMQHEGNNAITTYCVYKAQVMVTSGRLSCMIFGWRGLRPKRLTCKSWRTKEGS